MTFMRSRQLVDICQTQKWLFILFLIGFVQARTYSNLIRLREGRSILTHKYYAIVELIFFNDIHLDRRGVNIPGLTPVLNFLSTQFIDVVADILRWVKEVCKVLIQLLVFVTGVFVFLIFHDYDLITSNNWFF